MMDSDLFVKWSLTTAAAQVASSVALLSSIYLAALVVYRLYFHPLAGFPGAKLAALTQWYAGYYDLWEGGKYVWVIKEMHEKYGPIIRIKPDTLHINDPDYIDQIYAGAGKRRDKGQSIVNSYFAPGSGLATKDHDMHRHRRAALNPFFSKQSVRRTEPVMQRTLVKLLDRLERWGKQGTPARMRSLFRATTKDIIQAYAFGDGSDHECLDMEDLNENFFTLFKAGRGALIGSYLPWVNSTMASLPPALVIKLHPGVVKFINYLGELQKQIESIKNGMDKSESQNTIFHTILASEMPESEKAMKRLREEGYILVVAGTETTAHTLSAITYHMLSNPAMLKRLKAELATAIASPNDLPEFSKLEQLPFLTAVIQEAFRLHPGSTVRQDRIATNEDLPYQSPDGKKYVIPAGSTVGMSTPLLHQLPELYPSPEEYRPERYIENPRLMKYQLSFSRGSRSCLGMNLAHQELYLILAGIFRRYDLYDGTGRQKTPTMELYNTSREDIDFVSDFLVPGIKEGSEGVRVIIRNAAAQGRLRDERKP